MTSEKQLPLVAEQIWKAGVDAVRSENLIRNCVEREGDYLHIGQTKLLLGDVDRICVVGAGKAGAGMATAFEAAIGDDLVAEKLSGWVNVPADCLLPTQKIKLHAARPAGVNEPTAEGVLGSHQIVERISQLGEDDVCVVLISGGGSALLPLPAVGIELADKQQVTRLLMQRGATIQEMNTVRKQLSRIKGGGLAQACNAGRLITLIISDVVGNPLDVIASGPTMVNSTTAVDAIEVLQRFVSDQNEISPAVWKVLEDRRNSNACDTSLPTDLTNIVIGDNATALQAAAAQAKSLGYTVHSLGSDNEGEAASVGRDLTELCLSVRDKRQPESTPACILSGGEPIVQLDSVSQPGQGGRNQEVALGALLALKDRGLEGIAVLSGGTDGEDGPTDAAGGVVCQTVLQRALELGLDAVDYLTRHDSYNFLQPTGGLLQTGPTHTNVMDLRVAVVDSP